MRRSLAQSLSILIITALALILTSCGEDPGSNPTSSNMEQKYTDGHLVCSGRQQVLTDYQDADPDLGLPARNREYDRIIGEIIQNPAYEDVVWNYDLNPERRMFGVTESEDGEWFDGLIDQFDAIVAKMSGNEYAKFSDDSLTTFPTACWVEDETGAVILGAKPKINTTSTTSSTGGAIKDN